MQVPWSNLDQRPITLSQPSRSPCSLLSPRPVQVAQGAEALRVLCLCHPFTHLCCKGHILLRLVNSFWHLLSCSWQNLSCSVVTVLGVTLSKCCTSTRFFDQRSSSWRAFCRFLRRI